MRTRRSVDTKSLAEQLAEELGQDPATIVEAPYTARNDLIRRAYNDPKRTTRCLALLREVDWTLSHALANPPTHLEATVSTATNDDRKRLEHLVTGSVI